MIFHAGFELHYLFVHPCTHVDIVRIYTKRPVGGSEPQVEKSQSTYIMLHLDKMFGFTYLFFSG